MIGLPSPSDALPVTGRTTHRYAPGPNVIRLGIVNRGSDTRAEKNGSPWRKNRTE